MDGQDSREIRGSDSDRIFFMKRRRRRRKLVGRYLYSSSIDETDLVNSGGHDIGGRELFLVGRRTTELHTFFPVLSRVVTHFCQDFCTRDRPEVDFLDK